MAVTWKATIANAFLFFLIFGLSATVDFTHFKEQLKNKRAIATGVVLQFLVLPLLGFLVVKILDLDRIYGITLLIITSSPGGAYSNWFCSIFNADLALSVTMTAISTIASVGMLPLNVFIYSRAAYSDDVLDSLDWNGLGISLAVVISAITLGLLGSYKFGAQSMFFRKLVNKIGNIAGLGLIIFSYLSPEGGQVNISGRPWIFYLATPAPIVLGLISSLIISTLARMKKPERLTVSVECCYQNTGIAITSCLTIFSGDEQRNALGVPFFYTGMQTLIIGLFCLLSWKIGWTKAPSDCNFFTMLLTNYEIKGEDDDDDSSSGLDIEDHQSDQNKESKSQKSKK